MIRRPLVAVAALATAVALSSCATFTEEDLAARVGDAELEEDELAAILESDLGQQLSQSAPVGGLADGDIVREFLSAWIAIEALDQAGVADDADARATAEADLAEQLGTTLFLDAPAALRDLLVTRTVISEAVTAGEIDPVTLQPIVVEADVYVDPRYGWWDVETGTVAPFGVADAP